MPTYNAFISYSRKDQAIATKLERELQRYRIPKDFRNRPSESRFHIFRDLHDISLGDYGDVISDALKASDYLIILCSPESAKSDYVGDEIRRFAALKGADHIIPVLVAGRPNAEVSPDDPVQDQAFPQALLDVFDEPLAADFRAHSGETSRRYKYRLREAKFQLIAKLLGTAKSDALVARDLWSKRLRLGAIAALFSAGIVTGGWYYYDGLAKSGSRPDLAATTSAHQDAFQRLRRSLSASIPSKGQSQKLLIATWNIRDFARFKPDSVHARSDAALNHIAEVLSYFDIIAVQEMKGDEAQFNAAKQAILTRLGRHWAYVGSGITEGRFGNGERLGFFFDTRSVRQTGDVDEVVLSQEFLESVGLTRQIARTPFIASFEYQSHKLTLANAHIYFGSPSAERYQERLDEFDALTSYLVREDGAGRLPSAQFMLLGDLQVADPDEPQVEIAKRNGMYFSDDSLHDPSNANLSRYYDQFVFGWNPLDTAPCVIANGVPDLFSQIYRETDYDQHLPRFQTWLDEKLQEKPDFNAARFYRLYWRSYQLSDHFPKWVLLDFAC